MTDNLNIRVGAQTGENALVRSGQLVRITDIEGHQVGDLFARRTDPAHWLSVSQTRNFTDRLMPRPGDDLFDCAGQPLLHFEEDHSPGLHDMLYPPCDEAYYRSKGLVGHPNCRQNFLRAAAAAGWDASCVPDPLNLFQDSQPDPQRGWSIEFRAAASGPGDYVIFRALEDVIIVLTACSVDDHVTNNFRCTPLQLEVHD